MDVWVRPTVDIRYLDEIMLEPHKRGGHPHYLPKPVAYDLLKEIPHDHLQQWCVKRGVYQIITEELVAWLEPHVRGKRAVEICAGHGTLGRALGIPMTDSYMQVRPEIRAYYERLQQAIIEPPPDVQKMSAERAVSLHSAEVVIGSWVTQKWIPGEDNGSVEGVDELSFINEGVKYIHIGNDKTHGWKQAMKLSHDHHYFPWLVSRAVEQSINHLCVWPKEQR